MRSWVSLALVALAPAAWAQPCAAPYDFDSLLNDLGAAEAALRGDDMAGAIRTSNALRDGLKCLDQALPQIVAGRILRAIGGGIFVIGDDEEGKKWLRTAAEIDGAFAYAEGDLPEGNAALAAWEEVKAEGAPEPADAGITLGEGTHYLDGRAIEAAAATPDRYHLYQRDLGGLRSWVIDGNAFPAEASGGGAPPAPEPEPEPEPVADVDLAPAPVPPPPPTVVLDSKDWPAERVVLVAGGGGALAAGGVLYALSTGARKSFDEATTVADVDRYQTQTNTLVIGSGAAFAAGAGMLGFGVLFFVVDGDPRPGLDIRF